MRTIRKLRIRLGGFLLLLAVFVIVAASSLMYIENPVARWLVFAGATLSGIPTVVTVIRLSTEIGRLRRDGPNN